MILVVVIPDSRIESANEHLCDVRGHHRYLWYRVVHKTLNVSNIMQHKSIYLDLEMFENLNGLVMEESVYSGGDTKF